ncbi:pantoate--beta-alanine ligase [Deinococcus puniceus]|uniref:pantoate--beta-alanine ligase n=1 Tax=Deinococcus puniceus TaxID=1182568 RepID=UPI001E2A680A|nr:pantoate--beta-alanine ligase [Deinococcus puniceus]
MPQIISDPAELRSVLAGRGRVGFVPTMGYLHEGHATLISQARAECDLLVVSIFVNPLQFGAGEDLNKYPRDLPRDLGVAGGAGADVLFTPSVDLMYPDGFSTRVTVSGVSEGLDGASRPGHFTGVATVVLKLLNLVRPDRVYLGEKDWQQLAVLRRMVRDLNVNVDVIGVPTVRAASGLALSSRNAYLTPEQQARAAVLQRALRAVQDSHAAGETQVQTLQQAGLDVLATDEAVELDYLSIVDAKMQPLDSVEPPSKMPGKTLGVDAQERDRNDRAGGDNRNMTRVLLAARMFGVRLIDNLPLMAALSSEDQASESQAFEAQAPA